MDYRTVRPGTNRRARTPSAVAHDRPAVPKPGAIDVSTTAGDFDRLADAAMPIVDSYRFEQS